MIIRKYSLTVGRGILCILVMWWFATYTFSILAQPLATTADDIDVMFVLDTSYSMNETDKDKISIEMLKLFSDISYSSHTRIGFVAYNDTIEAFAPLTEITNNNGKENIKKSLDLLRRTGRTDTGLGLKKGWELLKNIEPDRKTFIVLLTDGEIDVNSANNQRTTIDSLNDINGVVDQAAEGKIPIYTVAMGNNGMDLTLIKEIAHKTGAESYIANVPQDLLEIFSEIFATGFTSPIVPVTTVVATGEVQEITVKIPDSHAAEANLIFLSSSAMTEVQVFDGSSQREFYHSQNYSAVKVMSPQHQEIKVVFKGAPNDVVKVSMLLHHDLQGHGEVKGQPIKGKKVTLSAYLTDHNTDQPITGEEFYSTFVATAIIRNLDTEEKIRIPASATENGWEINHIFLDKGRYSFYVEAGNDVYSRVTNTIEVNVIEDLWIAKAGIAILVLVMMIMIYYREKLPKPIFTGKVNVYYHRLQYYEEEEMPALIILLEDSNGRGKVNLCEILQTVNPNQGLREGEKIWFAPGADQTVIFSHVSACIIMVGQTVINKNQNWVLRYGDKIHIIFPDNGAEIELHYRAIT